MSAPRVLVTGAGGPAGRAVCELLADRGVTVVGADMAPSGPAAWPVARVPPAAAPDFVAELLALATSCGAGLVIPTVCEELPPLAALADPRVAVGERTAVALARDKWWTHVCLAAAGVGTPRSSLPPGAPPAVPFVSRPRTSRGGRGVAVHDRLPRHGAGWPPGTLLQELAPGMEYAVDLHVGAGGDVVVVLEKTALAGGQVGNALSVRRTDDAGDVAEIALAAMRALGLTGAADVDVRRRADGMPVVLEVNPRFGAHAASAPEVLDALLADRLAAAA